MNLEWLILKEDSTSFLSTQNFSSNGPSDAEELLAGLSVILSLVCVDEHIDRGVDGEDKVADGKHDDDALRVAALLGPLQFCQLVNVEEEPMERHTA